eukprot:TRINITY_DN6999_c1_g1_i1.p1 TRINITY_DN6999_c1_g1~~TRINITY_DN6999_c1_g1_i1.p1  ORF type:complete len:295 (+),score=36.42 TRINITY_DN6999_c1_g1_i1:87-971(+)
MGPECEPLPLVPIPAPFRSKFDWIHCNIYYFGFVDKVTRHGRLQRRVLLVVTKLILLCNMNGEVKRMFKLSDVTRIHQIKSTTDPDNRIEKFLLQFHVDPSVVCKPLTRDTRPMRIIEVLQVLCENATLEVCAIPVDHHKFPLEYGPFDKDDTYLSIADRKMMWLPNLPHRTSVRRSRKNTNATNVSKSSNTKPSSPSVVSLRKAYADCGSNSSVSPTTPAIPSLRGEKGCFPKQTPTSNTIPVHIPPSVKLQQQQPRPRPPSPRQGAATATNHDWLSFVQYWETRAIKEYSSI